METSDAANAAGDQLPNSQPGSPVKVQEQDYVQQVLQDDEEEGYDTEEEHDEVTENNEEGAADVVNLLDVAQEEIQAVVQAVLPSAEDKQCWICLACEQDDLSASWTHPCK